MERFKFEMIRANEAEEITYSVSTKFTALVAAEVVSAFVDFVSGCGFSRETIVGAFEKYSDALEPKDLSHLSEEEFQSLAPQGYHAP